MKMGFIVALLLLSVPFAAIATESTLNKYDDLEKYYPLTEGNILIYNLGREGNTPNEVHTTTSCGTNQYGGNGCVVKSVIMDSLKSEGSYEVRGNTLSITGGTNPFTNEFSLFDNPKTILQSPLTKNATWTYTDDKKEVSKVVDILPKYTVIAGEFADVIKIEKKMYTKDKKTKKFDKKPTLTSYEYYAANVGLIKMEFVHGKKAERAKELVEFKSRK